MSSKLFYISVGEGVVKGCIVYILAVHKLFNEVIGPLSFGQEAE